MERFRVRVKAALLEARHVDKYERQRLSLERRPPVYLVSELRYS